MCHLQMKGEEFTTIRKPPNHKLFDMNNKEISPVLQRRMANQAQSKATPSAPVFNITLGNEFANILRPPVAAPAMMPPAQAIPPAPLYAEIPSSLLLHPSRLPGPEMDIAVFCQQFGLAAQTLEKLKDNCYGKAQVLRFVHIDDLKQMGFRMGEIAGLQDAVEKWSVSRNA
jgi:hypothetical protein